jgi:hypothetical protein
MLVAAFVSTERPVGLCLRAEGTNFSFSCTKFTRQVSFLPSESPCMVDIVHEHATTRSTLPLIGMLRHKGIQQVMKFPSASHADEAPCVCDPM